MRPSRTTARQAAGAEQASSCRDRPPRLPGPRRPTGAIGPCRNAARQDRAVPEGHLLDDHEIIGEPAEISLPGAAHRLAATDGSTEGVDKEMVVRHPLDQRADVVTIDPGDELRNRGQVRLAILDPAGFRSMPTLPCPPGAFVHRSVLSFRGPRRGRRTFNPPRGQEGATP